MNYEIDDIIEFRDGKYLILDIIKNNNNTYLYLINNDEFKNDISITKAVNNDGVVEYKSIDDDAEFDFVINKLFLDLSNEAIEYIKEE